MSGLKFTGERFLPSEHGQIAYEHYHRYASCLDAARGKVVLDIASGEGFGSALLSRTAKKVIGVDIDRASVRYAKQTYGHLKNVSYRTGDCRSIPLRANSIDLIVSFETIEHIQEHEAFLDEIKRILRPKGALIISSPDKENYSERPARENPFHLHELTHNAFVRLFEDRFGCVRIFRQRLAIASFLLADKSDGSGELQSFMGGNRGAAPGSQPLRASLYSIAVCAQRADAIPPVRSSIHLDPEDDLYLKQEATLRWASGLHEEHEQLKRQIKISQDAFEAIKKESESAADAARTLAATVSDLTRQRDEAAARLAETAAALANTRNETERAVQAAKNEAVGTVKTLTAAIENLTIQNEQTQSFAKASESRLAETECALAATKKNADEVLDRIIQQFEAAQALAKANDARLAEAKRALDVAKKDSSETIERLNRHLNEVIQSQSADAAKFGGELSAARAETERLRAETVRLSEVVQMQLEHSRTLDDKLSAAHTETERLGAETVRLNAVIHSQLADAAKFDDELSKGLAESRRLRNETIHLIGDMRSQLAHTTKLVGALSASQDARRAGDAGAPREVTTDESDPTEQEVAPTPADESSSPIHVSGGILSDVLTDMFDQNTAVRVQKLLRTVDDVRDAPAGPEVRSDMLKAIARLLAARSEKLVDSRRIQVSIIIPVYNQIAHTIACVQSVLDDPTRYRFEVLIGDDCSSDKTRTFFEGLGGVVKVVSHKTNFGFLNNCNETAKVAQGEYLIFLNNDTIVLNGWLDGLIEPFERLPKIGYTGSKVLMADGTLQEAGGIVWRDGSAWNYGRNQDPRLPDYNYLKDADYCSGCSIAISRKIWNELGGFDELFIPAYYEDVDLAFSVRALGYRSIYNPASAVIHLEGATHGRDVSVGMKAHQVRNGRKFAEKWAAVLTAEHYAPGEEVLIARDRSSRKPHILIVDHYVPQFDRDTGSRTMFEYLKLFIEQGFHVVFWPANTHYDAPYVRAAQALGVEVIYGAQYHGKFGEWLTERAKPIRYALLLRPTIAPAFIEDLQRFPYIKLLFFGVDLHFYRMRMEQQYNDSELLREQTKSMEECERNIWSRVDVVYYPGDFEIALVKNECKTTCSRLLPLFMFPPEVFEDAARRAKAHKIGDPQIVLFVAGFAHPPNIDAAVWLVHEIWPRVTARFPNAILYLAGSSPSAEVRALAGGHIHVTGFISDSVLEALYEAAHVAVVPLRYGAGVKGKLLEAFRFGVPGVTTSVGIQGIPNASTFCAISDEADGIAEAIIHLLSDPVAARLQAEAAVQFLAAHYSRDRIRRLLALDIPEFGGGASRSQSIARPTAAV